MEAVMSSYIRAETGDLFDPVTKQWVGVIDLNGNEQLVNGSLGGGSTAYKGPIGFRSGLPDALQTNTLYFNIKSIAHDTFADSGNVVQFVDSPIHSTGYSGANDTNSGGPGTFQIYQRFITIRGVSYWITGNGGQSSWSGSYGTFIFSDEVTLPVTFKKGEPYSNQFYSANAYYW
jgi:hypothetical protein